MRYIFVDEAGTSAREPVTVIVGLIAHADDHVLNAEALADEALGGVPDRYRDGFTFHATEVFNSKRYQDAWSINDRLDLLTTMMAVPRRIGMAICVSAQWRGAVDFTTGYGSLGLSPAQSDHFHAFVQLIGVADRNIRRHAGPREVATVVAEDVPEMRRFLKQVPMMLRQRAIHLAPDQLRRTVEDEEAGHLTQSGDIRVVRIRNSVHFVEKMDDPLVQIADACAYGLRRFLAREKFGDDFARAILGDERHMRVFSSPGGAQCYWPVSHTHESQMVCSV